MKSPNGAVSIIMSPDKILLFHRDNISTIPFPDCWQFVGGGIEADETPEQGLIREVKEEASFDLVDYTFISKVVGSNGEDVWVYAVFVGKKDETKFKLGPGEGQEIGWFTLDEALSNKLAPGIRIILSKYRDLIEDMMKTKLVPKIEKLDMFS